MVDSQYHRIIKRNKSDLSYVSEFGKVSGGPGTDALNLPLDICTDDVYLYVADSANDRVMKLRGDDMTYVAQGAFAGAPVALCTDKVNLYVIHNSRNTISKVSLDDLSIISSFGESPQQDHSLGLYHGEGVTTDGTYLYIGCNDGEWLLQYTMDFTYVKMIFRDDYAKGTYGGVTDGTYLWISSSGPLGDGYQWLVKRNCSNLASVWAVGGLGTGDTQWNGLRGTMGYDGEHLYVADYFNHRIKKLLASDGAFVSKIGSSGGGGPQGNDIFYYPRAITVLGAPTVFPRTYATIIG